MSALQTPLTKLFGIKHPIFLAGMNVAAGPRLAAAVTNAGGLGSILCVYMTNFKVSLAVLDSILCCRRSFDAQYAEDAPGAD